MAEIEILWKVFRILQTSSLIRESLNLLSMSTEKFLDACLCIGILGKHLVLASIQEKRAGSHLYIDLSSSSLKAQC
jgi:hypothetical protein